MSSTVVAARRQNLYEGRLHSKHVQYGNASTVEAKIDPRIDLKFLQLPTPNLGGADHVGGVTHHAKI